MTAPVCIHCDGWGCVKCGNAPAPRVDGHGRTPEEVLVDSLKRQVAELKSRVAEELAVTANIHGLESEVCRLRTERDRAELHQKTATEAAHELLARAEKAEAERDSRQKEVLKLRDMLEQEVDTLVKFAAEREREACAQVAEVYGRGVILFSEIDRVATVDNVKGYIAAAIRARGNS